MKETVEVEYVLPALRKPITIEAAIALETVVLTDGYMTSVTSITGITAEKIKMLSSVL